MTTKNSVCVVIPAFNESGAISDVIASATKIFRKSRIPVDIVVVNDGSSDNTSNIAKGAGATVIDHILNTGAGGATATGLRYAEIHGYQLAVTMDADGQHAPQDVIACIKYAMKNNTDLLIGSRLLNSDGMSATKIIGNKGLSLITRILFGINTTDSQSGLRVFSRKALEGLRWKTSGYEFCSEMLWRANQINLKIDECPIKAIYTDYSMSKGQSSWNGVNILKSLVKQRIVEVFE